MPPRRGSGKRLQRDHALAMFLFKRELSVSADRIVIHTDGLL
jgi:hypothetical protein